MTSAWPRSAIFYHVYPLGLFGAPPRNDFSSPPARHLQDFGPWIDHLESLGVNALYLGPVFESTAHGYDTADFHTVDRRLGTRADLAALTGALHRRGMRVVLDAVLNHVGRDFWAFRDVQARGPASSYADWFDGLRFGARSPHGDAFSYQGWNGHYDLVKLNLRNPAVVQHLFDAIRDWVESFAIDGLRLDAADCLDREFLRALSQFRDTLPGDPWLMGELIHGDYRTWANHEMLDSTTNYECYKGLYSSHVDRNYFEIAYSLQRQFGPDGIYRDLALYTFCDNHDVDRVASRLRDPAHLYPLYCLLFTIPGVPSIYYGSEWGIAGRRTATSDRALRPALALDAMRSGAPHPDLPRTIARLSRLRSGSPALREGGYRQLGVQALWLGFLRETPQQTVAVVVNGAGSATAVELALPDGFRTARDLLDPRDPIAIRDRVLRAEIPACWARVFELHR
jgi:glycosidase